MLLLLDVGNTRIKWAVLKHDGVASKNTTLGHWLDHGSVPHHAIDELGKTWREHAHVPAMDIARVVISNVAGKTVREKLSAMLQHNLGGTVVPEWFASTLQLAGVRNTYAAPEQLGCDRFATMIAARALFPQRSLIVATCGTATTIDALTAQGEFVGGMILPGLGLMAESLAQNTAQLPNANVSDLKNLTPLPSHAFADNTKAAIQSGCLMAQAGAIERAVAQHGVAMQAPVLCILSGGAASYIAPYLSVKHQIVENLVLIGLQVAVD